MSEIIKVAVISEDLLKELVGSYLSERDDFVLTDNIKDADIVVADIGDNPAGFRDIKSQNSGCKILALSEEFSVDIMVKAMRFGADEFLSLPLIKSEFFSLLDNLNSKLKTKTNNDFPCKIISVFSNKGGIGKTSIACNLALELASVSKEKVALVDLNFQMGDIATFMDVNPPFDMHYLLENAERADDEFLLNILTQYKDSSLYILADTPYLKGQKTGSTASVSALIKRLKTIFSYVVIDARSGFDDINLMVLNSSDIIFLPTVANLPALKNTQRCLDLFERMGYSDKVKIVLNRYMENDEITLEDVQKLINTKIYWKIPNNYFTMMSSINKGVPVCEINPDSNVARCYVDFALSLYENLYKDNIIRR